jgi:hypothetical protein
MATAKILMVKGGNQQGILQTFSILIDCISVAAALITPGCSAVEERKNFQKSTPASRAILHSHLFTFHTCSQVSEISVTSLVISLSWILHALYLARRLYQQQAAASNEWTGKLKGEGGGSRRHSVMPLQSSASFITESL